MAYVITDDCIACGICTEVCPMGTIEEDDEKYVIDDDGCVWCGSCMLSCPIGAIIEK